LNLLFLVLVVIVTSTQPLQFGVPMGVKALFVVPLLTPGMTIGLPILGARAWAASRSTLGRVHYALVTMAAAARMAYLSRPAFLLWPFQSLCANTRVIASNGSKTNNERVRNHNPPGITPVAPEPSLMGASSPTCGDAAPAQNSELAASDAAVAPPMARHRTPDVALVR
jgi:hypothetical protein